MTWAEVRQLPGRVPPLAGFETACNATKATGGVASCQPPNLRVVSLRQSEVTQIRGCGARLSTVRSTKSHFVTVDTEPLESEVLLDWLDGNAAAIGTSASSRLVGTLASAHRARRFPLGVTCAISQTRQKVSVVSRNGDQGEFANA